MTVSKRNRSQAGFTLIELLVVMIILAVLAAFAIPRVLNRTEDARRARAISDVKTLGTALDMYKADNGEYPTTEQGLDALRQAPTSDPVPKGWNGPYLKEPIAADPWGNPYVYESPGETGDYDLITLGADGQPGGDGKNADYPDLQAQE
ncbi:MAG: type II secretion system major pseudopilin GspG [Armatimonadetes bacterium]|nr:type II secretion system major pseudopilin GspG [Armatimonadota bacterium]